MTSTGTYRLLISLAILTVSMGLKGQQVSTLAVNSGMDNELFLSSEGRLYGTHFFNGKVLEMDIQAGSISNFININRPSGIAEDSQGYLYISNYLNGEIFKIDTSGSSTLHHTANPKVRDIVKMPGSDTMVICQFEDHEIYKLAPNGSKFLFVGTGLFTYPMAMCYGPQKELYLATEEGYIWEIAPNGTGIVIANMSALNIALFDMALVDDNLYLTTGFFNEIYRVNRHSGSVSLFAGSTIPGSADGPLGIASFSSPHGIAASRSGDSLFVIDNGTGRIRMISGIRPNFSNSTQAVESLLVSVYPNPCRAAARVELNEVTKGLRYKLISLIGEVVSSHPILNRSFLITPGKAGVYFLQIMDAEQVIKTVRLHYL